MAPVIRIRGKLHDLRRAVDQLGHALDVLAQSRRSAKAARRQTLPGMGSP